MNQDIIKDKKIRDFFKSKKLLFSPWAAENQFYASYQQWYKPMSNIFKKFVSFDPQKTMDLHGQEKMNQMFLETIEKEQPDYILLWIMRSEFFPETLLKIREVSPKSVIISSNYDDDAQFYDLFRHYSPFFDYILIGEADFVPIYKADGIKNVFKFMGVSMQQFRFLNLPKKYDVSFTGMPKYNRHEYVKYLKDNNIKISLSGHGWKNYPDLGDIYTGAPDAEEFVKIMNQSKIVLCFSRNVLGVPHFNPRLYEVGSTKSFSLVEEFDGYLKFLKKGKEIIMFTTKEDLLEKINYYLEHEEEREKIATAAYNKILKNYSAEVELEKFFIEVYKKSKNYKHPKIPEPKKKVKYLSESELSSNKEQIKESLKDFDYIAFSEKDDFSEHKDYFQIVSLEKSKKPVSCCDYVLKSGLLGNLMLLCSKECFNTLEENDFFKLIKLSQLMVKKQYFLDNIEKFQDFNNNKTKLFEKEECVFVSIPLVYTKKFNYSLFPKIKKVCATNFLSNIKMHLDNKDIFTSSYIYLLVLNSLFTGRFFIIRAMFEEGKKYLNSKKGK